MPIDDSTTYDEQTLHKVYAGLELAGITGQQAVDAVSQIQNLGILFRERSRTATPVDQGGWLSGPWGH